MYADIRGPLARSRAYTFQRRDPRYIYSAPVTLQRFLRFGPVVTRGVCLDVSMRGMSALVCGAPRVGETVVIELPLLDIPVEMLATVRHSTDARSGFEFYPLSPMAERGIQDWILENAQTPGKPVALLRNPITPAAAAVLEYSRKCGGPRRW